jgi:hypothetical protein
VVETDTDDVIANPVIDAAHAMVRWPVRADSGVTVVRQRVTNPPPDNPSRMRPPRP